MTKIDWDKSIQMLTVPGKPIEYYIVGEKVNYIVYKAFCDLAAELQGCIQEKKAGT